MINNLTDNILFYPIIIFLIVLFFISFAYFSLMKDHKTTLNILIKYNNTLEHITDKILLKHIYFNIKKLKNKCWNTKLKTLYNNIESRILDKIN